MTHYIPRQQLEFYYYYRTSDHPDSVIEAHELQENVARESLAYMGLKLLRSNRKPATDGQPAYKIISASRLTIEEVRQFIKQNVKPLPVSSAQAERSPNARKRAR